MTSKVESILRGDLQDPHSLWLEDPREIRAAAKALRKLAALDWAHADILEQRLFRGRSAKEIGEILEMPSRSVELLWTMIRAWTLRELAAEVPRSEDAFGPFAQGDPDRRGESAWPSIDRLPSVRTSRRSGR